MRQPRLGRKPEPVDKARLLDPHHVRMGGAHGRGRARMGSVDGVWDVDEGGGPCGCYVGMKVYGVDGWRGDGQRISMQAAWATNADAGGRVE